MKKSIIYIHHFPPSCTSFFIFPSSTLHPKKFSLSKKYNGGGIYPPLRKLYLCINVVVIFRCKANKLTELTKLIHALYRLLLLLVVVVVVVVMVVLLLLLLFDITFKNLLLKYCFKIPYSLHGHHFCDCLCISCISLTICRHVYILSVCLISNASLQMVISYWYQPKN